MVTASVMLKARINMLAKIVLKRDFVLPIKQAAKENVRGMYRMMLAIQSALEAAPRFI